MFNYAYVLRNIPSYDYLGSSIYSSIRFLDYGIYVDIWMYSYYVRHSIMSMVRSILDGLMAFVIVFYGRLDADLLIQNVDMTVGIWHDGHDIMDLLTIIDYSLDN